MNNLVTFRKHDSHYNTDSQKSRSFCTWINFKIVLSALIKNTKGKKLYRLLFVVAFKFFLQFKRGQNEKGESFSNQIQYIRKPEDLRSLLP